VLAQRLAQEFSSPSSWVQYSSRPSEFFCKILQTNGEIKVQQSSQIVMSQEMNFEDELVQQDEQPDEQPEYQGDGFEAAFEEDYYAEAEDQEINADIKLFDKWPLQDIKVEDMSLIDYLAVKGKNSVFFPHTAGRYSVKRFRKAQCPIVERLVNSMMMHGRNNGKKLMAVRIVKHAFEILHLLTNENPVQVLVDAIINSGPREDSTRIGSAGTVRRQAVDVAPLRRVNQAIWLLTTGAREAAFRNIKTIAECLADELMNAAKGSVNSYAIKKKDELERVAKSNR